MAAKGKASKSATGASMSKYDVEVESRLQALEAQAHPTPTGATQKKVDDRLAALEAAVASLQTAAPATTAVATGDDHDKLVEVEAALNKVRGVLGV